MRRPEPIQQEITFNLEDMFFSTTDSRGIILDGNDVFVRISQYSRAELIGSPHNIIRHPDMPKLVFKVLWSTIQDGKPICAYVKNLAKNGAYYWVFATVVPFGENYISIRMKPTTPLLGLVEKLYQAMLSAEKEHGVEASLDVLVSNLKALNFADYGDFVLAALSQELLNRNELQSNISLSAETYSIASISQRELRNSAQSLFKLFSMINKLSTFSETLTKQAELIEATSQNIEFLALNTNIEAEKLGTEGRCLGVVAHHISSNSESVKQLNNSIAKLSLKILGDLGEFKACQLSIALSTLQTEMLSCFVDQMIKDPLAMNAEDFKRNSYIILNLIEQSLNKARPIIQALGEGTDKISEDLALVSKILAQLDFIQITGSIECARLKDGEAFTNLFGEIVKQTEQAKQLFLEFSDAIANIISDINIVIKDCNFVRNSVLEMKKKVS